MQGDIDGPAADITRDIRDAGVSQVRVVFLDYNGLPRARSVSVDSLPLALQRGVNFSSPTVDFNSRDAFPPSAAFDLASPDFWARPDPSTYFRVPYLPRAGQMFADLVDATGGPWNGCPRTALRAVIERAEKRGLSFNVGFEPEGYIFRPADGGMNPAGIPEFASLDGLDLEPDFMTELLSSLALVGLVVEQWSEEYGPGQIEVNLRYGPALAAADGLAVFRQTFRAVARWHGLLGTFMPKPFGHMAGSGLHVHLSASPSTPGDNQNLFDDPADSGLALSALGRHALAGLLAHGEALTALGASTVNSYKRFLPGSWAPTHIMYARASRAAFVRVPEPETPRRLELRVGDPAGNPYLYLTGILAAMLDGIERALDPGPPLPGDVAALSAEDAADRSTRPLPPTLGQALDRLACDDVVRRALGSLILDEFVKVKRSEWDAFCSPVSDWDRSWYLQRY